MSKHALESAMSIFSLARSSLERTVHAINNCPCAVVLLMSRCTIIDLCPQGTKKEGKKRRSRGNGLVCGNIYLCPKTMVGVPVGHFHSSNWRTVVTSRHLLGQLRLWMLGKRIVEEIYTRLTAATYCLAPCC